MSTSAKKPPYQESRLGITIRLAKKDEMSRNDYFSQEQWDAIKQLRPNMTGSTLVQKALAAYAEILADEVIREHEEELQRLHSVKNKLWTAD